MGNIKTPKPIYNNGIVIEFSVKKKEIYYKISKWNKAGFGHNYLEKGKLDNQNTSDILQKAQQMFTGVMQK